MDLDDTLEYDEVMLEIPDRLIGEEVRNALDQGWYEHQEAELVRDYLPSSIDVIELGAGIGYVSCVIDEVISEENTHIAVEPNPAIVPVLERTKQLNDANYVICKRAYSSDSDSVELRDQGEYWNTTTHPVRNGTTEVPSIDLQEICERYTISTCCLVMDIEGAEYELFDAELDLLESRCSVLVVEFHEEGPYAEDYDDNLENSSFELIDGIESVCVYRNTRFSDDNKADNDT